MSVFAGIVFDVAPISLGLIIINNTPPPVKVVNVSRKNNLPESTVPHTARTRY
ncbi:MAG: hypothetical protein IPP29_16455 [Bacteroidetes bacterium]|nr:hypothetical protein [Bacteroidota bacterium]